MSLQRALWMRTCPLLMMITLAPATATQDDPFTEREPPPVVGRWDVTVSDPDGEYPSWFEVRQSGFRTLVGSYVGRFGSARPIAQARFEDGKLRFALPPQWERRTDEVTYEGQLAGDELHGETTDETGRRVAWVARRAPSLVRSEPPRWHGPVELFNGRDLEGWMPRGADMMHGWVARDGILTNATPGVDLMTASRFADIKLQAEFRYPEGSNSGIYLRGRYEVQIEDNFGSPPDDHKIGGVYGFLTPRINAARPDGEWQTMEITLLGREVSVTLNGEQVIERQAIPGITGGALDSREGDPGPILLQGDHGPIEFRKLTIWTALVEK